MTRTTFTVLWLFLLLPVATFSQHVYPPTSGGSSFTVITVSQLTGAADNWNPSGLATASLIRLSGDNQFRIISGITAPASPKSLALANIGADYPVLLTKEDGASTAANRFSCPVDIRLYPGMIATFDYDDTNDRWKLASISNPGLFLAGKELGSTYYSTGSTTSADYDMWLFTTGGGTTTAVAPTATIPRCVRLSTSTSGVATPGVSQKGASVYLGKTSTTPNAVYTKVTIADISNLSDGTQNFTLVAGLPAAFNTAAPDGAYFKYNHNLSSGNWQCVTQTASVVTATNSGITVAVSTKYILEVYHRPDNSVAFFINGVFIAENTTNVHDGFAYSDFHIVKTAGTTARTVDLYSIEYVESRI